MIGVAEWLMVGFGLGVLAVRRRSTAVTLATGQALALAGIAIYQAHSLNEALAAAALGVRALALTALLVFLVSRTRETRPVRASVPPAVRCGIAVAMVLLLLWLVPIENKSRMGITQVSLALVAFGMVMAATRRATLFQILGIIFIENGLALAALGLTNGSSLIIELGVTLDLSLIAVVASVFHDRIFAEFGAGDISMLSDLRD